MREERGVGGGGGGVWEESEMGGELEEWRRGERKERRSGE